jgi:outer membrane lipoprotein SlyB
MNAGNTGGIGAGAVVGGLVGGLLGNQVGGGRGKTAATVAGVVGGAVVGNQVEQRNAAPARQMYQVGVRLDNGAYQTIMQDSVADLRVGSRVRIQNERVYLY